MKGVINVVTLKHSATIYLPFFLFSNVQFAFHCQTNIIGNLKENLSKNNMQLKGNSTVLTATKQTQTK